MSKVVGGNLFENMTKEEIVKQISELRKNIKKKHRSIKRELLDTEESWENKLKPISEPLKKLFEDGEQLKLTENNHQFQDGRTSSNARKRKLFEAEEVPQKRYAPPPVQGAKRKQQINLPTYPGYESDYDYDDGTSTLPEPKRLLLPNEEMEYNAQDSDQEEMITDPPIIDQTQEEVFESNAVSGEHLLKTPEGRSLARNYIDQNFQGRMAKEYFLKNITGGRNVDTTFGVRVRGDSWMLGDKEIEIDVDDLIINKKRYKGTRGLYELIFMSFPNEYIYDEQDMGNYKTILEDTNVHRFNYLPNGKLRSSRSHKYKNIISQLVSRERAASSSAAFGSGMDSIDPMRTYEDQLQNSVVGRGSGLLLTTAKPNVIYWDDPNELVERLRTLTASQEAGNTGLTNEINAITEELVEYLNKNNVQCIE